MIITVAIKVFSVQFIFFVLKYFIFHTPRHANPGNSIKASRYKEQINFQETPREIQKHRLMKNFLCLLKNKITEKSNLHNKGLAGFLGFRFGYKKPKTIFACCFNFLFLFESSILFYQVFQEVNLQSYSKCDLFFDEESSLKIICAIMTNRVIINRFLYFRNVVNGKILDLNFPQILVHSKEFLGGFVSYNSSAKSH
jgi:hypothetical protein